MAASKLETPKDDAEVQYASKLFANFDLNAVAKLWLIFLALYFPMMTVLPLSIDAERMAVSQNFSIWIGQGRWASYLFSMYLLPPPVIPYFSLALFGLVSACAYYLLLDACRLPLTGREFIGFSIFSGFPIWSFLLEFPTNSALAGIALLLCSVSVYLLSIYVSSSQKFKFTCYLFQIVTLTFSIGVYQTFVFVYLTMVLAVALLNPNFSDRSRLFYFLAQASIVMIVSVILYYAMQKVSLWYFKFETAYIGSFFRLDLLLSEPLMVAKRTLSELFAIYTGSSRIFGTAITCVSFIMLLAIVRVLLERSPLEILLFVGLLLAPFGMAVVAGGALPHRALIGVPTAVWAAAMVATRFHSAPLRLSAIIAVAILGFQSSALLSQYQAERLFVAEFDRSTAAQIYSRIAAISDVQEDQAVDFYGQLSGPKVYPVGQTSTASASFFSWDNGNPWRMLDYMSLLGYAHLKLISNSERERMKPIFETMPPWPSSGSVRKLGSVVLIKLSNVPGYYEQ